MERKQEIYNFSNRTRLLAVRLLSLVKWASSAAKVDKSVVSFQDRGIGPGMECTDTRKNCCAV
jgi:hypothetical protein